MSSLRTLNHEDYKCWICLGTADEQPPHNQKNHNWCRPCKCNLVSHQSCLLEWAAEVASTNTRSILSNSKPKNPQCPQCKSPIHIVKSKSLFIQFREKLESANASGFQLFFITIIGGSLASAVYTSLYAVGAASLRCICPKDMALSLLGITLSEGAVQIQPLSMRRMLLVPSIPLILLLSGSRSSFADVVTLLMPLALADNEHLPWKFTGPRLTMAALPLIRIGYHILYDNLVEPIIQLCAARIRPSFVINNEGDEDDNGGLEGMGVNIEIVLHNGEEDEGNADGGNVEDGIARNGNRPRVNVRGRQNIFTQVLGRLGDVVAHAIDRALLPAAAIDDGFEPQVIPPVFAGGPGIIQDDAPGAAPDAAVNGDVNNVNVDGEGGEDGGNAIPPPGGLLRRPRAADWVFSTQGSSLRAGNILLLPLFSGIMGSGLSLVPVIRRLVPNKFNRNVLGGMLVIVLRDLINIATALLRVRQENSRHVLDYTEVELRGLN